MSWRNKFSITSAKGKRLYVPHQKSHTFAHTMGQTEKVSLFTLTILIWVAWYETDHTQ